MKVIEYYVISIYDSYDGEWYDYEKFTDEDKAKQYAKDNYQCKTTVRKIVLELRE